MPIYEYACEQCGEEFEVQQRITENALSIHEGCGGPVKRLISLTAFSLKGDGWYSDHYGLKKNDSANGNGSGGCKKSECCKGTEASSTASKTETKEAPKSTSTDAPAKTPAPKPGTNSAA